MASLSCWVVTYYQPGEGPSEVVSVHESENGAWEAMREFVSTFWTGDDGYWVNDITGAVLASYEAKLLP